MLRKLLPLLGGMLLLASLESAMMSLVSLAHAQEIVQEAPIGRAGVAVAVSVSTSAWTKANTSTSAISQRSGYRITNPSSNSASMFYLCHVNSPTEAITVHINEVSKGSNSFAPCGPNENLYLLSGNTSSETGYIWEVGQ